MQVIIPMSGQGQRFKDAGYKELKPLIKIHNQSIVEHIIDNFSPEDDFIFICNEEHLTSTPMQEILEKKVLNAKIIAIKPHKLGPVYAVLQAFKAIKDDEPCVVNYCDFNWHWDYEDFKKTMQETAVDGSIICYKNFHPHLIGENLYASVNTDSDNNMIEIKEKFSFTEEKMDSFQSSGTYYFKKGSYVKKYFQKMYDTKKTINNEYYVSMIYNYLKKDNLKVNVYEIPYFCQWGTPEDFEEYKFFADYFINDQKKPVENKKIEGLQILIPMAGLGSRFQKEGYKISKPLIPVSGKEMVVQAVDSLPKAENYTFVLREEHLKDSNIKTLLEKEFNIKSLISVAETTEGQACTCLLAKDELDLEAPLLIAACDNAVVMDYQKFDDLTKSDTQVAPFVFKNYFNANRFPQMYGWVKSDKQDNVENVSVKVPLSENVKEDYGIVGAFYFKKAKYFLEAAYDMIEKNQRVNNEFYVDTLINNAVELGFNTKIFLIDKYICWGTPNDLKSYEYWENYHQLKNYKTV